MDHMYNCHIRYTDSISSLHMVILFRHRDHQNYTHPRILVSCILLQLKIKEGREFCFQAFPLIKGVTYTTFLATIEGLYPELFGYFHITPFMTII